MSGEPLSECVVCDVCPHPHLLNEDGVRCKNPRPASPPPAATATAQPPSCAHRKTGACGECFSYTLDRADKNEALADALRAEVQEWKAATGKALAQADGLAAELAAASSERGAP